MWSSPCFAGRSFSEGWKTGMGGVFMIDEPQISQVGDNVYIKQKETDPFHGFIRELEENNIRPYGGYLRRILENWVKDPNTNKVNRGEVNQYLKRMEDSLKGEVQYKFFVADSGSNGVVAGVIGYNNNPPIDKRGFCKTENPFELINFYSDPYYQGTGAGKFLIERIETEMKSHGATEIVLVSSPRFSKTWPFYEKSGYTNRGTICLGHQFY